MRLRPVFVLAGLLALGACGGAGDDPDRNDEVEEGAWEELPAAPIGARINHSLTWVDGLVIVWGGQDQDNFEITADGAAWDPGAGTWHTIPAASIESRWAHDAVWTGEELIVWGGTSGPDHLAACFRDGAAYDPVDRSWEAIPAAPGPDRCGASVVWGDDELLVFGGHEGNGPPGPGSRHDDGVAYDPDAATWRAIPPAPVPPRAAAVAAWVHGELVVYGGHTQSQDGDGFQYLADGAAYDPDTETWRELPASPLPPLNGLDGVDIGDELMLFGGQNPAIGVDEQSTAAAAYDPAADEWRTLADLPSPLATAEAVWTGDVVYVLGAASPQPRRDAPPADEGTSPFVAYVIDADSWVERPDPPAGARRHHAMAWTGAELIVWGGEAGTKSAPGLRWDPPG